MEVKTLFNGAKRLDAKIKRMKMRMKGEAACKAWPFVMAGLLSLCTR